MIPLAAPVSEDKIKAQYQNGVLKVTVPKSEAVLPQARGRLYLIDTGAPSTVASRQAQRTLLCPAQCGVFTGGKG